VGPARVCGFRGRGGDSAHLNNDEAVANMGHLRKTKIYCDAKTKNQWLRASGSRETPKSR
jgi:hypothetical protein